MQRAYDLLRPVASFLCTPGAVRRLPCAVLAGLLTLGAAAGEAAPAVRQVLVLQSFDRGNLTADSFTGNFRVDLDQRADAPVNVVQIAVSPTGSVSAPEQAVVDYIRSTFANRPQPDLIVSIAGPAALFARKYRQQLFPDTPLLLAAVDQTFLRDAPLGDNETAVSVNNDYPRVIENILQVLPQTRQVFMVMGSGQLGQIWHRELESQFRRFHDRLTFIWSDDLSLQEILRRSASLPRDSAIFYFTFGTDGVGGAYADERVLAELHATANAPMFAVQSVMLGYGIVGGALMDIHEMSRNTVDLAIQILNGAAARSVGVPPPQSQGRPTFDWRELQRWGIAESRLPAGSAVRYRTPSLWDEHKATILGAVVALAIQSLLIGGLLYQRGARRRAEIDSRRNLVLAADASRRQTMSALTSSIAHEVSQPLNAMRLNSQALQMMVTGNRATADAIGEVLSDIQSQGARAAQIINRLRTMLRSRHLDQKPIDIRGIIDESLALVAHDLQARRIQTTVDLSATPSVVSADPVLLQQVLVNLVINAVDAMADVPAARRHLTIRSEVRSDDVEVSVQDAGTGLPPQIDETLFGAFVTTKSDGIGIGLTIARRIVDAHGGTIDARNNPEGGATFTVTLPRSTASTVGAAAQSGAA